MILHTYSITNDTTNDLGLIFVPQALSACSSIMIVRMYLKLTINAMVVTPFSRMHVVRMEKGEPSHLLRACDG